MENNKTVEKTVEEKLENPQEVKTTKEQLLDKGEQNYQNVSKFISTSKDKFSGWIKSGVKGLGGLVRGGLVRAFAAPAAIGMGAKFAVQGVVEEAKNVAEGAKIVVGAVAGTVVEGVKSAIDDVKNADKFVGEKVEQAGEWIGYKAAAIEDFSAKKYQEAKNWTNDKKEAASKWVADAALTTEAVASLIAEPVVEKYNQAKESIEKGYNNALAYGQKSIESAGFWARKKKDAFIEKKNAIRLSILERKGEIQAKRLEKTKSKLEQYKKVEQLELAFAA